MTTKVDGLSVAHLRVVPKCVCVFAFAFACLFIRRGRTVYY